MSLLERHLYIRLGTSCISFVFLHASGGSMNIGLRVVGSRVERRGPIELLALNKIQLAAIVGFLTEHYLISIHAVG